MAADVVVVGAGIVGAACARALALAGALVVVLDRGAAAAATSAYGEGNLLVSDKGPGPELELAKVPLRRWTALADELGPRFPSVEHEAKGGLVVVTSGDGLSGLRAFAKTQRLRLVAETTVAGVPAVVPTITGRAWVTGTANYLLDPSDPFPTGFDF